MGSPGFATWVRHLHILGSPGFAIRYHFLNNLCYTNAILGSPGCARCAFWVRRVRHLGSPGAPFAILGSPAHLLGSPFQKCAPFGFAFSEGAPWVRLHKRRTLGSPNSLRDGTRSKRVVIVAPNECIQCTCLRRLRIL